MQRPCSPSTACGSVTSPTPGCSPMPPATSSPRARWPGTGRVDQLLTDNPRHVIDYLLALDAAMSEHLVTPRRRAPLPRPRAARGSRQALADARRTSRPRSSRRSSVDRRAERSSWSRGTARLKRDARADGLLRPDRAGCPAGRRYTRGRPSRAGEVPRRAARRVPGHLRRPGPAARRLFSGPDSGRARPPGHRGRRPQPGDLRLARCVGLQHPRLRDDFPRAGRCDGRDASR